MGKIALPGSGNEMDTIRWLLGIVLLSDFLTFQSSSSRKCAERREFGIACGNCGVHQRSKSSSGKLSTVVYLSDTDYTIGC
ncbi:hypothetical protein AHAS_Ahas12G0072100 [Arachis hypogaea]